MRCPSRSTSFECYLVELPCCLCAPTALLSSFCVQQEGYQAEIAGEDVKIAVQTALCSLDIEFELF